ncbi:hypothetical protein SAMN05421734_10746 [Pelagirhabdus alkalitolerans]|uniref:Uncharacterized protein n=1 Tax=Pelagirhabdus alkalitolerans TaxID=1612202 RepID=A0A1G6L022_9BACI|nr:hypothetical protein [Pelagirhabdus alkalitolerans]SDC36543.1 hypothetical protein SAMN05421734_10746 [Pelagirhabdus alkalitolerans]
MKRSLKFLAASFLSIGILAACNGEIDDMDEPVEDPAAEEEVVE